VLRILEFNLLSRTIAFMQSMAGWRWGRREPRACLKREAPTGAARRARVHRRRRTQPRAKPAKTAAWT